MNIMTTYIKSAIVATLFMTVGLHAQQDPMVTQYMFSGHFINPGYAGSHDYANITVLGRKQWVGFDGSPLTSLLSFDKPVQKKNIGFGALLSNDFIGVTNRTELAGTIAYHLKVGEKAKLGVGLKAGLTYYTAKLTQLQYWDQGDQVFVQDIKSKFLPNAGLGIYFYMPRFYAGISTPGVINYKPETFLSIGTMDAPKLERHYFGTAGVVIPAGSNLDFKPNVMVKYVPNAPLQADFNLNVLFYKILWVGASYRTGDGMQGLVEYQATKNLRVGYAYDFAFTNLRRYNQGSHEIMLAWDFIKEEKIRYKSPRFF